MPDQKLDFFFLLAFSAINSKNYSRKSQQHLKNNWAPTEAAMTGSSQKDAAARPTLTNIHLSEGSHKDCQYGFPKKNHLPNLVLNNIQLLCHAPWRVQPESLPTKNCSVDAGRRLSGHLLRLARQTATKKKQPKRDRPTASDYGVGPTETRSRSLP